jgi:hypothetical protein
LNEVAFLGFDFESADHDHYWEKKVKNETCHNMNQEALIIRRFIEEVVPARYCPPRHRHAF